MAYAALVSLAQTISQILNHDHTPTTLPLHQEIIASILDHIVDLKSFLEDLPQIVNSLEGQIRDVANAAEDAIEYLLCEENQSDCGSSNIDRLKEVAEKFMSTAGDVADYVRSNYSVKKGRRLSDSCVVNSSRAPTSENLVVGFYLTKMRFRLLLRPSKLQVITIVGKAGSGKTTLAKLVYTDASDFHYSDRVSRIHTSIVKHFDIRGWVTVPQDYSVGSIASDLLASIRGISDVQRITNKDEIGNRLTDLRYLLASMNGISAKRDVFSRITKEDEIRNYLMGGRYLIVMDNIRSKKALDDLKELFPDNNNGSRIILTTRIQDVGVFANTSFYEMPSLGENDSWRLLRYKVFGDQPCPSKIEPAGRVIAARCGGLPLSIVMMGGLLSKIKKSRVWRQIAESDCQLETIMSLSYIHLPLHLKSCFLYMGGFPETYKIRASELIKLWVAEGFIKCENESKSLEDEGEDCLEDLVQRGLVLVTARDFDGNIKSCSLHDIVRDFCIRQGRQEKLLLPVVDYLPSPILRRHFLPLVMKNHKRVSATWNDLDLKGSMHCSRTHSIICIPQKGYKPRSSVHHFNLLRVLHVLRRNDYWDWEPSQVFDLIYLTYLASNIPTSIVPPTISKLQNLETLIIYRSDVCLPVEIWRLSRLRHLIAFSFQPLPYPEGVAFPLENLQTLSMAQDFKCTEMIPNIRKLGIRYSTMFNEGYHDDYLRLLFRLEKLKLETYGAPWTRRSLVFPQWLIKLTLSGFRLPWVCMRMCGSLPNLQVLKLRKYACAGKHWDTSEGEFVNLRLLLIDESNLKHWTTEGSHFPQLKCLMLYRCPALSEIPVGIGDIRTLRLIEVDNQSQSLFNSAIKIQTLKEIHRRKHASVEVRVKHF
ncbi:putative late blight resistance protein homolog R1A-10 [Salvia miltiorrhiza]|uniref:putative late blight resistance protein homolog R1A-10 n=1 Tax=Salvia miltiorrhiza TaxID=226208 RepID=UPI0025ABF47C|nr:putative late blight resistance protein homolog R1A-10 [Salvia miltiorrhiza]